MLVQSGAQLVEVGTTNRTYVDDYAEAIAEETAAILRVHLSNFVMIGFTETPTARDLASLAHSRGVPLLNDLGSGAFLETARYGLAAEPTVSDALSDGSDLALFSGDKLLGGPQAGIAVGRKDLVDRLKRHPLARAVRIDKMNLAALTATLISYVRGKAEEEIPVWRMISATPEELGKRARGWIAAVGVEGLEVMDTTSAVGGGSLPGETLPTRALSVPAPSCGEGGPEGFADRLRAAPTPVVARIADDRVVLDPRTVMPGGGRGPGSVAASGAWGVAEAGATVGSGWRATSGSGHRLQPGILFRPTARAMLRPIPRAASTRRRQG